MRTRILPLTRVAEWPLRGDGGASPPEAEHGNHLMSPTYSQITMLCTNSVLKNPAPVSTSWQASKMYVQGGRSVYYVSPRTIVKNDPSMPCGAACCWLSE